MGKHRHWKRFCFECGKLFGSPTRRSQFCPTCARGLRSVGSLKITRDVACGAKRSYPTKSLAKAAARAKRGRRQHPYACRFCGRFHLSTGKVTSGNVKKQIRAVKRGLGRQ